MDGKKDYLDKYLGEKPNFWLELKKDAEKEGKTNYIREIANLRGKISFYESRIKEMSEIME